MADVCIREATSLCMSSYRERQRDAPQRTEGDDDRGFQFGSVKPWVGNAQPPTWWDPAQLRPNAVDAHLDLDFVYGYRTRQARSNLHWVDEPTTFVYHSASVCVVSNIVTREQKHYLGHTDDVLCLDYHPKTRRAVSGGVGANATAPMCIWSVDNMTTKQRISGFLQFGVTCVCFSFDGTRVFGVGDDTNHTIAMYDVETGVMLAQGAGDRNKIVHLVPDTTIGRDSHRNVVTVGVSHIKFWDKKSGEELLIGKKAIGGDISKQTMVSACCTVQYVLVGNVSGAVYVFSDAILIQTIQAHDAFVGALFACHNTVYSGGRDGLLKQWNFEFQQGALVAQWDLNPHSAASAAPVTLNGTKTKRSNGARAISVVDDRILVGTALGSIYCILDNVEVTPILEAHFEEAAGTFGELWGLDVHPTEPLFCSSCDDCTLRLWSMDLGSMILMTSISFPSRSCAFSWDGQMIACGHENGAFSIWDATTLVPLVPFTRKREARVTFLAFSPDGKFLAMSMGNPARVVDVYYISRSKPGADVKVDWVGYCDLVAAQGMQLDWSLDSTMLQCSTTNYEVVRFNIPSCEPNMLQEGYNEVWATHSSVIGWGVQGIWEGCSDGTDINGCSRSRSGRLLAVGYDSSRVRLFNFPCVPRTFEKSTKVVFPKHREYTGHSSHVTRVAFSADDRYVFTAGGMDLTILRWKVVPSKAIHEAAEAPTAPQSRDAIVQDAANGVIRELKGTTKRNVFVDEQQPTTTATSQRTSGSARPSSGTASRLHETTNTMRIKAEIARQHREHLNREQASKRRFSTAI